MIVVLIRALLLEIIAVVTFIRLLFAEEWLVILHGRACSVSVVHTCTAVGHLFFFLVNLVRIQSPRNSHVRASTAVFVTTASNIVVQLLKELNLVANVWPAAVNTRWIIFRVLWFSIAWGIAEAHVALATKDWSSCGFVTPLMLFQVELLRLMRLDAKRAHRTYFVTWVILTLLWKLICSSMILGPLELMRAIRVEACKFLLPLEFFMERIKNIIIRRLFLEVKSKDFLEYLSKFGTTIRLKHAVHLLRILYLKTFYEIVFELILVFLELFVEAVPW